MKKIYYSYFLLFLSCGSNHSNTIESPPSKTSNDYATEIIQPPVDYSPISEIEGEISDVSYGGINRYSFNLIFQELPSDSIAELEMRHHLYKVWSDNKDSDALEVKCFDVNEGEYASAFATGTFAPEGDWSKADPLKWVDKFDVKFKFYGH